MKDFDRYDRHAEVITGINPANASIPEKVALAGIAEALADADGAQSDNPDFGKFANYVQPEEQ